MKVLLKIFIPLCILSFIAFGISIPILGTNEAWNGAAGQERTIEFTEEITGIKVDIGAYDCTVKPYSGDTAKISISGDNFGRIKAQMSGGELEVYSEGFGFGWLRFNLFSWFGSTKVTVEVPEKEYETLKVYTGAGTTEIKNIRAADVDLSVGAGTLKYTQPDYTVSDLEIDVSAGKLVAKNAKAKEYSIDVSAGSAEVYGLTGSGSIDVSAGSAKAYLAELNGSCDIDVSAGSASLMLPDDASAKIYCDKSAGSVNVNACGVNRDANDDEIITLNGGEYSINADVSAGSIKIGNTDAGQAEQTETATAATTATHVGDVVESAVAQAMGEVSDAFEVL